MSEGYSDGGDMMRLLRLISTLFAFVDGNRYSRVTPYSGEISVRLTSSVFGPSGLGSYPCVKA